MKPTDHQRKHRIFSLTPAGGAALVLIAVLAAAVALAGCEKKDEMSSEAKPATIKLGIVSFLTGGAAGTFGIPARNGAEMLIEAINAGKLPAPYNTKGFGGLPVEAVYIDESGGSAKQVTEFRNLVQRQGVDAVVGYIGSGNCLAVAPVAEELKMLTVFDICGTPRIFEDAAYKYVFRTTSHSTMDNVAAAHYVLTKYPNLKTYGAINQNYAWGQDSWRDFKATTELNRPTAKVTTEQFPKLFSGQYSSEISTLLASKSEIIHTSLWAADLESFINQANARGLPKRSVLVMTTGENSMYFLGSQMPEGSIVGARGPYGPYAEPTELSKWLRATYRSRYVSPPPYPTYMMAQAILGLKVAWDKAAAAKGSAATREEVIAKFEGIEYEAFGTTVKMTLGKGHQARIGTAYGVFRWDKAANEGKLVDITRFAADCVMPPEGVKSEDWIKGGMQGAKCN